MELIINGIRQKVIAMAHLFRKRDVMSTIPHLNNLLEQ